MSIADRRRALLMASGNANTEIEGDWGRVYIERVSVGENTISNTQAAYHAIIGERIDQSGVVIGIRRINAESPTKVADEFGGFKVRGLDNTPIGYRWRNSAWQGTSIASGYDGVVTPGSVFEVVSFEYYNL